MSYIIDYSSSPTKAMKQLKAINDTCIYLGERSQAISALMVKFSPTSTLQQLINDLTFAGVQGYPAKVFILWSIRTAKNIQLGD